MSVFEKLNGVDVTKYIEKKNGLSYLSWANAWREAKKICPEAKYTIYESEQGCFYHTDGKTCWVKTGVEIDGLEYIEYLPVMNFRNQSISVEQITSTDVNKAIQRSLTKALARHGLGLYVYAGEDLPEEAPKTAKEAIKENEEKNKNADKKITKAQLMTLNNKLVEKGKTADDVDKMKKAFGVTALKDLTQVQYDTFLSKIGAA